MSLRPDKIIKPRPDRIVHLIDSMAGGGTQEFLLNYLSLSRMTHCEHYVIQLTSDNDFPEELKKLGCRHITINHRSNSNLWKMNPWYIVKAYRIIRNIKPDLLHARLYLSLIYAPILMCTVNIRHILYTIEGSFSQMSHVHKLIMKLLLPRFRYVFTGYPREYDGADLPKKKLKPYKYCLVFEDRKNSNMDRPFQHLRNGGPNIASVGRLHSDKGHLYAIDAVKQLKCTYPDIQLYIAGSGSHEKELKQRVKELKLEDNVIFCGFVHQIKKFWRKMDVGLQCSVNENLNLSSLWALHEGVPVVKFDVPGMDEQQILVKYEMGLIADYLSVNSLIFNITKLLNSPTLKKDYSQNAKNYIRTHFNAIEGAVYYDTIYSSLLSEDNICVA